MIRQVRVSAGVECCIRFTGQGFIEKPGDEPLGKEKRYIGADPEPGRELLRQPALHTPALHHQRLAAERIAERMLEDERERVGQVLEPVAEMKMEAGVPAHGRHHITSVSDKSCPTNRLFCFRRSRPSIMCRTWYVQ